MRLYPVRAQSFCWRANPFPWECSLGGSSYPCSRHVFQNALAVSNPHVHSSWSPLGIHTGDPQMPVLWHQFFNTRNSLLLPGHMMGEWDMGLWATDDATCHISSLCSLSRVASFWREPPKCLCPFLCAWLLCFFFKYFWFFFATEVTYLRERERCN